MADVAISSETRRTLAEALVLCPSYRAAMTDRLLDSLAPSDSRIEELWAREAEARIAAVEAGEMGTPD